HCPASGIPPLLLLFRVRRSVVEPVDLCLARPRDHDATVRGDTRGARAGSDAWDDGGVGSRAGGMTVRIAYFAPLLGTGGTQRHLQQVLSLLDPARFEATVYTLRPGGEVETELRASGVDVRSLSVGASLAAPRSPRGILSTARTLPRARVDVVHGYQWRPSLVGAIVGRLARVPLRLASKRSLTGDDAQARGAWRRIGRQVDTDIVNADALRIEGDQLGMHCRWALLQNGIDAERFTVAPAGAATRA